MSRIIVLFLSIANMVLLLFLYLETYRPKHNFDNYGIEPLHQLNTLSDLKNNNELTLSTNQTLTVPELSETIPVPPSTQQLAIDTTILCAQIPFPTVKDRDRALQELMTFKDSIRLSSYSKLIEKNFYRVIIPTEKSILKAQTIAKELNRLNFKEFYIIVDSKYQSSVSVGVYKKKNTAENIAVKLKKRYPQFDFNTVPLDTVVPELSISSTVVAKDSTLAKQIEEIVTPQTVQWTSCENE